MAPIGGKRGGESGNPSTREQQQREREHGENQPFERLSVNPSSEQNRERKAGARIPGPCIEGIERPLEDLLGPNADFDHP